MAATVQTLLEKKIFDLKSELYLEKLKTLYAEPDLSGMDSHEKFDLGIIKKKQNVLLTTIGHPLMSEIEKDYTVHRNGDSGYKVTLQYQHVILEDTIDDKLFSLDIEWEFDVTCEGKEVKKAWSCGGFFLGLGYYKIFTDVYHCEINKIRRNEDVIIIESNVICPDNLVICVPK